VTAFALRAATRHDARLLWEWANDPAVRANAFHPEPIPWETHRAWLDRKLAAPDCRLWMLERDGEPVGQVRYDSDGDAAEIGLSVAAAHRGQGLGKTLLALSVERACAELEVARLVAFVMPHNCASIRAFETNGFRRVETTTRAGHPCLQFDLACVRAAADRVQGGVR
jgi:RimJ/RimL family protein N-acetyltransferase